MTVDLKHEEWLAKLPLEERQLHERIDALDEALRVKITGEGYDAINDTGATCPPVDEATMDELKSRVYSCFQELQLSLVLYASKCTKRKLRDFEVMAGELSQRMEVLSLLDEGTKRRFEYFMHEVLSSLQNLRNTVYV